MVKHFSVEIKTPFINLVYNNCFSVYAHGIYGEFLLHYQHESFFSILREGNIFLDVKNKRKIFFLNNISILLYENYTNFCTIFVDKIIDFNKNK